jgi:hypothetical protein
MKTSLAQNSLEKGIKLLETLLAQCLTDSMVG